MASPSRVKPAASGQRLLFFPPQAAEVTHLVRENLRLLGELSARYELGLLDPEPRPKTIASPSEAAAYLQAELSALPQEQLRVILLDTRNHVLGVQLAAQGGANQATISMRDIFREAVRANAAAIIMLHNHPSGDPSPSPEDVRLTREAGKAGDLLGIDLIDHIVIGRPDFISLREAGLYKPPR